jgi:hypothetical protein
VQEEVQSAAGVWSAGLNATGGAINPKKSHWILADYLWTNGLWGYSKQPMVPMEILLPDSLTANIIHGDIRTVEKALGVWAAVDGNNGRHLTENVTGQVESWINRMRNGHLPTQLGWMGYRYKLWPGIQYGLATLTIPLTAARRVLNHENFHSLSFLGVNRNVKWEWRTIHRSFGGIGIFSFAGKHTISMINNFIQHYRARTTLAKKFTALLEALQLELGCKGNPLRVNYDEMHILVTECWMKSFWERLHYYCFRIHIAYPPLTLPHQYDCLLAAMFWEAGDKGSQLQYLNRCRLALRLLFLSDIITACGCFLDVTLLSAPHCSQDHRSSFTFPNEKPSQSNWKLWLDFWSASAGPGD